MFNGTPTIEQISDDELRITGITLDAEASLTLVFHDAPDDGPEVIRLPSALLPPTAPAGAPVSLPALMKIDITPIGTGPFTNLPPSVEKTAIGGVLRAVITNTSENERTQDLEIYVTVRRLPDPSCP